MLVIVTIGWGMSLKAITDDKTLIIIPQIYFGIGLGVVLLRYTHPWGIIVSVVCCSAITAFLAAAFDNGNWKAFIIGIMDTLAVVGMLWWFSLEFEVLCFVTFI